MAKPRLHLDADASNTDIEKVLLKCGHDITRTRNEWIQANASDEEQLVSASARGRSIFTFNARHFESMSKKHPRHAGIILSHQKGLSLLIKALDRFFKETTAEEKEDQVRWLSDWEK